MHIKCALQVQPNVIQWAWIFMKGLMLMSPKEKKYTERIAVFFTKEQLEQVRAEAERLGLDVSAYVRMVVMKEVNRDDW